MLKPAAGSAHPSQSDIDRALAIFVHGFCATRSFTYPFVYERVGNVWSIRDAFRRLNYRLHTTEPLMIYRLQKIPRFDAPLTIQRVDRQDLADRLNKAARRRQVLPEHLAPDAPLRQYVALDDDRPVGWVRSITTPNGTWCSNMYVQSSHRRRGIGRALLAMMLRDDRKYDAPMAALTASHTGAMLYPLVGYEQIGLLYAFTPRR